MKESVNVRLLLMEFIETCAKFKHFIFITEWWLLKIIVLLVLGDLAYSAAPRLLLWEKQQYLLLSRYGTRHLAQTFLPLEQMKSVCVFWDSGTYKLIMVSSTSTCSPRMKQSRKEPHLSLLLLSLTKVIFWVRTTLLSPKVSWGKNLKWWESSSF